VDSVSEETQDLTLCLPFCATMFQNVGLKVMDARANQKDVWLKSTNCSSATVILDVEKKREKSVQEIRGARSTCAELRAVRTFGPGTFTQRQDSTLPSSPEVRVIHRFCIHDK